MRLPTGWGDPSSSATIEWPRAHGILKGRYRPLGDSRQLDGIFDLATKLGTARVILEAPYVDHDYRSEYSQHYARRFSPPSDRNERVVFLDGDDIAVGFTVIRPTAKPVGRTVMAVPEELDRFVSCRARQEFLAYGQRYAVEGFPFMSQDGEYGRCAHVAIWSVARLQHAKHATGRHSIAAIVAAAGTNQLPDRTATSSGLTVDQTRQALRLLGLPVLSYRPSRELRETSFTTVMCQYLDSGFPVLVNTPNHLTAIVGYATGACGEVRWLRCDDNRGPYNLVKGYDEASATDPELRDWQAALVALPGRIHVPAESAHLAARKEFAKQLGAKGGPSHLQKRWDDKKIVGRTYATKPALLKTQLAEREAVPAIATWLMAIPTPAWAWVTEFRDVEQEPDTVLGTVLIDATGSKHAPEPVAADIDGWCVAYVAGEPERGMQLAPPPVRYPSLLPDRSWHEGSASP